MNNDQFLREFHERRQDILDLVEHGLAEVVESRSRYAWARDLAAFCIGTHGDALVKHWLCHRGHVQFILSTVPLCPFKNREKIPGRKKVFAVSLRNGELSKDPLQKDQAIGQRARRVLYAQFDALRSFDPALPDYGASRFREKLERFNTRWLELGLALANQKDHERREKNRQNASTPRRRYKLPDTEPDRKITTQALVRPFAFRTDQLGDLIPAKEVWQMLAADLRAKVEEDARGTPLFMRVGENGRLIRYKSFEVALSKLRRSKPPN